MMGFPHTLQDWAAVVQAIAAVAGLGIASLAFRSWQRQGQAQMQQQSAQVTIHNYPDAQRFGEGRHFRSEVLLQAEFQFAAA